MNLKPKECEDLFKLLDANDDGTVSKFEFATGFEKFRGKVVELKDAEMDRAIDSKRRAEHMQGTKASATKGSSSATTTTTRTPDPSRTMSTPTSGTKKSPPARASSSSAMTSGSDGGGGGGGGIRKVASPSSAPTKVRAAQSSEGGSGGAAGAGGDGTKRKKKTLMAQVSRGVGKLFGFTPVDEHTEEKEKEEEGSNSAPASKNVKKKKWFGFSFVEMFGLKALTTTIAPARQSTSGTGEDREGVGGSGGDRRRGDPRIGASDAPPETIWVRGTKAEGYRVNIVKSSSLKKLRSLFDDMDADRDGHITSTEFNAFVDGSKKGSGQFQRDIFDRISNEDGLCSFKSMLQVLYPGATHEHIETMLKMSKSWQEKDLASSSKSRKDKKGPTKEQLEQAESAFRTYDVDKDGFLSEEEFANGLSATGVYSHEDAIKEFNRMDIDDNRSIDMKEFTIWYVAMDEIGRRSRRNA